VKLYYFLKKLIASAVAFVINSVVKNDAIPVRINADE
jgi:hypothetical protein